VRLLVAGGAGSGQSILLRRVASVIGSGQQCKVRLKHPDISNVHAAIVNTGESIFIRDLVSHKGTFLNNLRAEHERIEDDDIIKVDPWELQVQILAPSHEDLGDCTGLGLDPTPSAIVLENTRTDDVLKLPREVNLLGRRPGCDFFVDDRSVSRAHALIFNYLSHVVVFDLASRNGIKVNGRPLVFSTLQDNDKLTLGTVELNVKMVDPLARVQQASGNGQILRPQIPKPSEDTFSDHIDLGSAELDKR
jgi:pSer/pThr/pTyr-binding forkhead associated (FHA) protein